MKAEQGMVRIQAQTMLPARPQRTADTECVDPTPTMEPVMVWVVDTGMPSEVARNRVIEPESSAQKPSTGRILVMGQRITKIRPVDGFCAELSGSITLFLATSLGIPVSTTHTITGSIVGVGSTHSVSAVRWGLAGNIVWAWILTIPCSAFIAAVAWLIAQTILS